MYFRIGVLGLGCISFKVCVVMSVRGFGENPDKTQWKRD